MRKLTIIIAVLSVCAASVAWGGATYHAGVTITDWSKAAQGTMITTRLSSNTNEFIECTTSYATSGNYYGHCLAMDANNTYRTCNTWDPEVVAAMRSISSRSFISFRWEGGRCTSVRITNGSRFLE